ncbi:hypothetical protein IC582_029120 [Cucumis melo]
MTKIVGTVGPNSRSVQVISACFTAAMLGLVGFLSNSPFVSIAWFDFSWGSPDYHQETLENLKIAVKSTKKLCAEDGFVVLTPNQELEASSELLPINYGGLSKVVKKGDTPFLGQYLFTGSETSVWLEVFKVKGDDVGCVIIATWGVKNKVDFLSLSHARHVEDVQQARQFLSKLGDLNQTQIFAKMESVELIMAARFGNLLHSYCQKL